MPRCPFCDRVNLADAKYCSECGAEISGERDELSIADSQPSQSEILDAIEDPLERQVLSLLVAGSKIQAIKIYREATGVGLKEAKESVEAMAERSGVRVPRRRFCSDSLF